MTDEKKCPSCGAPVDASASDCPSCGTSISNSLNAPTMMASSPPPVSRFPTGAAALDEIKRLIRDGNKSEAVKVHREHFQTSLKESKEAVEVLASDMPFQAAPARPKPAAAPAASAPGMSATAFEAPKQQSDAWIKWAIGCSIAFILFCCLCLILTISLGLIPVLSA